MVCNYRSNIYDERPQKICQKLEQILRPLGYEFGFNSNGVICSIKRGCKSKPHPYFYKDKRGKIYMKIKNRVGDTLERCIDYETDEWLAYYVYKIII